MPLSRWTLIRCALFWTLAGLPCVSHAAGPAKLNRGDICVVGVDQARLKSGGDVIATLRKGQQVTVVMASGMLVLVKADVDGEGKRGLVAVSQLTLHSRAQEAPKARPRKPKPTPKPKQEAVKEAEDEQDEDKRTESKDHRRRGGKKGASADWPQFRGPNRDGISPDTGLLKRWPSAGPELLWEAKGCGVGYSSVSMANGLIYTAGNVGGSSVVVAFDMDGKLQWQTQVGRPYEVKSYGGTRSTPTIDADRLFFETPLAKVVCLDAKTGKEHWSLGMKEKFRCQSMAWAHAESPLVYGDNVMCSPGARGAGVIALDKRTGRVVWTADTGQGSAGYASLVLAGRTGHEQILAMTGTHAVGLKPKTGSVLWKFEHVNKCKANCTNPIYDDGYVFIASGYGLGAVLLKPSGRGTREVWREPALDNHHGGVVLVDGHLYGHGNKGQWMCIEFKTGRVKYQGERGVGKGSVVYADGMLYCLGERGGKVGLVKATPDGHQVISSFNVPNADRNQPDVWAHPVVCGGRLYLRNKDSLFAYDVKGR